MTHRANFPLLLLTSLVLAGCGAMPHAPFPVADVDQTCLALFEGADQAVREARVGDAAAARVQGFPWLRVDRLLASFRDEVDDPEQFRDWLSRLADLDREARHFELQNLDSSHARALHEQWLPLAQRHRLPPGVNDALDHCRTRLNAAVSRDNQARDALREGARVPDAYRTWQRLLGAYSVARRITRPRVVALHTRLQDIYGGDPTQRGPFRYYAVDGDQRVSPDDAARRVRGLPRDTLGIPAPGPEVRDQLLAAHAPIWGVESADPADLPGTLRLDGAARLRVDTERATEYRWLSWTRFHGEVLVQLNYLIWFPERPRTSRFDLVAGALDGVIWRTTLDSHGRVLAHDSIHPCGCYYTLLPGAGWHAASQPRDQEPVYSPVAAPDGEGGERAVVWLAAGTRYFVHVARVDQSPATTALAPASADELRSLPVSSGARASAYGPDGLIAVSRRAERFVLWPLGVPSAGAMRQPGTHAVAFVGRRHFDDAWLLQDLLTTSRSE